MESHIFQVWEDVNKAMTEKYKSLGYDAVQQGGEIVLLNPKKFEIGEVKKI